mmetsp:Transcript_45236/g.127743  ORF Transcript_45236/g.127743 Transcript_45236/m.127743 type:complete len:82 (-) Transcript_45236:360-605(-)
MQPRDGRPHTREAGEARGGGMDVSCVCAYVCVHVCFSLSEQYICYCRQPSPPRRDSFSHLSICLSAWIDPPVPSANRTAAS